MTDDRLKYGTDFTSVRVHQAPGGNSSVSLAWGDDNRKRRGEAPRPNQVDMRNYAREQPDEYSRGMRQDYGAREQRWGGREQERRYEPEGRQPQQDRRYEAPEDWQPQQDRRYEAPESRPQYADYAQRDRYRDARQPAGEERPRGPPQRSDLRQFQQYGRSQYEDLGYNQPQRHDARGQAQPAGSVHTSVKVREPPGGRTNFTFG